MRTRSSNKILALIAAGAALASVSVSVCRGESKPTPQLAPSNAPKSEFTFRPGYAKDPFFPRSADNMIAPPVNITPGVTPQATVPDFISLKGISVVPGRKPLAIINNYTVEAGEDFTLKNGGKSISIHCAEIKEKSVVISVDGVTKELLLRIK